MFGLLGIALIFIVGLPLLFALAVYQAAAIEVRQRDRGARLGLEIVTDPEATAQDAARDEELMHAA